MIDFWIKKSKCTGCEACSSACPQNAIEMKMSEDGFLYPMINNNCIECGKCRQVCYERTVNNNFHRKLYAAWSVDDNTRFLSTSGGIFSELARIILQQGGIAVGAGYQENKIVMHMLVENEEELDRIRKSKYVQSEIGDIFQQIKIKLEEERKVIFCGTPCQVAGLKSYLGKAYEWLITCDFICRGVNSPKAFKAWLDEIELEERSKVKNVTFKYKDKGWKHSPRCTRIDFENGRYKIYSQDENLFMKGYLGPNLYIRPSCGECDFKGEFHQADITLGDFWGIEKRLDDDKGTSIVLINSKKGEEIFEKAKVHLYFFERDIKEAYKANICLGNSVRISDNSSLFLRDLDTLGFSKSYEKNV